MSAVHFKQVVRVCGCGNVGKCAYINKKYHCFGHVSPGTEWELDPNYPLSSLSASVYRRVRDDDEKGESSKHEQQRQMLKKALADAKLNKDISGGDAAAAAPPPPAADVDQPTDAPPADDSATSKSDTKSKAQYEMHMKHLIKGVSAEHIQILATQFRAPIEAAAWAAARYNLDSIAKRWVIERQSMEPLDWDSISIPCTDADGNEIKRQRIFFHKHVGTKPNGEPIVKKGPPKGENRKPSDKESNGPGKSFICHGDGFTIDPLSDTIRGLEGFKDLLHCEWAGMNAYARISVNEAPDVAARMILNRYAKTRTPITLILALDLDVKREKKFRGRDSFPGLFGTIAYAQRIRELAGHAIAIILIEAPPGTPNDPYVDELPPWKDISDFFTAHGGATATHEEFKAIGDRWKSTCVVFTLGDAIAWCNRITVPPVVPLPRGQRAGDYQPSAKQIGDKMKPVGRCPFPKKVRNRHKFTRSLWRIVTVDCGRITCPHCGPLNRLAKQAVISKYVAPLDTAYVFRVKAENRTSVRQMISDMGGAGAILLSHPDQGVNESDRLFVTTKIPQNSKLIHDLQTLTGPEASAIVRAAIATLPVIHDTKIMTTFGGWRMTEEKKKTSEWEKIDGVPPSITDATIVRVLEELGIEYKIKVCRKPHGFGYTAIEFHATDRQADDVVTGEALSKYFPDDEDGVSFVGWQLDLNTIT